MSDLDTRVGELRDVVRQFVDERDWRQFHSPKNLSMALAIEAAELMEHFQWITPEASRAIPQDAEKLAATLPNGRCVTIEGAGHTVQGDQPRAFADTLRSFLREVL